MHNKSKYILTLVLLFQMVISFALSLDIRVFSSATITQFSFTPISGKYAIKADKIPISIDVYKNTIIDFKIVEGKIQITKNNVIIGVFSEIQLESVGLVNAFNIKTSAKKFSERIYDDDLRLSVENNALVIINRVDLERYVAGVVQSEVLGSSKDIEFFKVQAIIARTYTLTNIMKHVKNGYNLCDETHCQAYYRRCNNTDIMMAVSQTFCDVIVDNNGKLISAAFHSNSGGQTQNSEFVWSIPTSYLKSVQDTFSNGGRNNVWETKIPKKQWLDYFKTNYPSIADNSEKLNQLCNFKQDQRVQFILDSIPLRYVRTSFKLRSSFFSVTEDKDQVILTGRGYGHGVGLSQEGAIKMVKLGYKSDDVIKYYYTGVRIVKYTEILKF
ncbi:MAG: SpoIID/LytB domain-containing protein [Bacteroidota bacterium]